MIANVEEEVTTEILGMALGQGKTKAKTLGEVIYLGEELEQPLAVGLGNTLSGVLDDEAYSGVGMGNAYRHMLAIGILG